MFCLTCAASFAWAANTSCTERTSVKEGIRQLEPEKFETSGPISPKDALEYMKTKKDLVIVDVAAKRWYAQEHFKGAINIPIEELSTEEEKELYLQLPKDRSVVRGCHANLYSSFAMVMLKGSCNVLIDDGEHKEDIRLENPTQGLYIGKMLWKEMYNFSDNSVMAVLSDQHYNKDEYIRDYNEYLKIIKTAAAA